MNEEEHVEPIEDKNPLQIGSISSQVTYIDAGTSENDRSVLSEVIIRNKDLFAWTPSDMPGIDPNFMCHKLSICANARPVAQRKRKMGTDRKLAVEAEMEKLIDARFIREVHYTTWLANVVMVKKPNGKWRMCTDYTNLNKACPKDAYPLPNIDRLADGAAGHKIFTFLDAYSGYKQIRMHPQDEEKMAFITDSANFCYRVMPFGLKNAGANYQRLMDKIFKHQIGRSMEVYVDDMVVMSGTLADHTSDLSEVFHHLREHDMRLNPEKCIFGVVAKFSWSEQCEAAFQTLKQHLGSPPVLAKPDCHSDMIVYLCVSHEAISAVLVQDQNGQKPIYFISSLLQDSETRTNAAQEGGNDGDIEVDQESKQLLRESMTKARTKKLEESLQQVVATIFEATPKEKDLEAKIIQNVLIIEGQ
uniref:Transposon Ty3-I Gag-Pol polyprotein n=1 Tax=Cajanus cajan TaxID=3821 RepID=A0A151RAK2_CAJCA|nr:Transposon Ty3-I Gag-Pol polyprotein [Cajanus cajan]